MVSVADSYLYPHVGHGIARARKRMQLFVCFAAGVPTKERASVEGSAPAPIAESFTWGRRSLTLGGHSDSLEYIVAGAYGKGAPSEAATDVEWSALSRAIDVWASSVHARFPIDFILQPTDAEYDTETDAWHEWSADTIPALLTKASALGKSYAWTVSLLIDVWRERLLDLSLDEQTRRIASLDDEARKFFKGRGGVPKPATRPVYDRPPTIDEGLAQLRSLAAEPPAALGQRFASAFAHLKLTGGRSYDLLTLGHELLAAKRYEELIDVARTMVSDADARVMWSRLLATGLLRSGRLEEARTWIPHVCLHFAGWAHDMDILLEHCELTEDVRGATAVYQVGKMSRTLSPEVHRNYALAPSRLPPFERPHPLNDRLTFEASLELEEFSALFDRWISQIWDLTKLTTKELAGFITTVNGTAYHLGFRSPVLLARRDEAREEIVRRSSGSS